MGNLLNKPLLVHDIELPWMKPDVRIENISLLFFSSSFTCTEEQLKSDEDFSFSLLTQQLSAIIGPLCERSSGEVHAEMRFRSQTREAERWVVIAQWRTKVPMITFVSTVAGENLL